MGCVWVPATHCSTLQHIAKHCNTLGLHGEESCTTSEVPDFALLSVYRRVAYPGGEASLRGPEGRIWPDNFEKKFPGGPY